MWQKSLPLIITDNLSTLKYFQEKKEERHVNEISQFIEQEINLLPWFYQMPVKLMGLTIYLFSLMRPKEKETIPVLVTFFPAYGLFNKIMRNVIFLVLFDILPFAQKNNPQKHFDDEYLSSQYHD